MHKHKQLKIFKLVLILCFIYGTNKIFADGPTPETPYYLAYYNSIDSTFHIILDGEYYERYLHHKTISPRFPELLFTSNPTDGLLRRFLPSMLCYPQNNWVEPKSHRSGFREIHTNPYLISSSTGICENDHFLITTPSRAKVQYSIDITIQDFGFEIIGDQYMWIKFVARTKKVNPSKINAEYSSIFPLIAIHKCEGLLLKLEQSLENMSIPMTVKSLIDSLQSLEKLTDGQIQKYFKNNKKTYDRLLKIPNRNISVQPFYAIPSSVNLIHYLITICYGDKDSYSNSIIVNSNGKLYPDPINHRMESIQQSRGVITYKTYYGPIQILVVGKSGFSYSGGISLFRVSPDTTLNEIAYFTSDY